MPSVEELDAILVDEVRMLATSRFGCVVAFDFHGNDVFSFGTQDSGKTWSQFSYFAEGVISRTYEVRSKAVTTWAPNCEAVFVLFITSQTDDFSELDQQGFASVVEAVVEKAFLDSILFSNKAEQVCDSFGATARVLEDESGDAIRFLTEWLNRGKVGITEDKPRPDRASERSIELMWEVARLKEKELNDEYAKREFAYRQKQRVASIINETLDRFGLALICPKCSMGAVLSAHQPQRSPNGTFQFRHNSTKEFEGGSKATHGGQVELSPLRIVPRISLISPQEE